MEKSSGSGCYLLIGVVVGDGVAAGAGVVLKVRFRIFQSITKRIFIASSGGLLERVRHFNDLLRWPEEHGFLDELEM